MSGGYAQQHVALVLVRAIHRPAPNMVEAEFERPMFLSYRNGINDHASRFMLCDDGTVQYFYEAWKPWSHHFPRSEFPKLPALPVVCAGFEV